MNLNEFHLAATTNDLTREPEARTAADIVEFRMDTAEDPLEQLSEYDGTLPIIATNRGKWFGGKARDTGRLDRLSAASRYDSVKLVDVELETARSKGWVVNEFRENGVNLIISHHDFDETPDQEVLDNCIEQCAQYGDIAKVAIFPQNHSDNLRLLKAIHKATSKGINVAGLSMGEIGSHTRIIGPIYGSKLGYAPLAADNNEYAPGQIPLKKLATLIETTRRDSQDSSLFDELEEKLNRQGIAQTD